MQATTSDDGRDISLHNTLSPDALRTGAREVHFIKLRPEPITPDNLATNVLVTSVVDSPLHSLYYTVHKVYMPTLLQGAAWKGQVDQGMQQLL
ncbi:MAG: hypothetical protein Q8Q63_07130, partial [Phaeovulum sp.]|uniref:hypothetical protein n=1 Tax=Phaeovulum sp. TaxID=2934796 RepID=UPI002735A3CD